MSTPAKFEHRLDGAAFWEAWVASHITRNVKDCWVELYGVGEPKDVQAFPDMLVRFHDDRFFGVEVKSRNINFNSVGDFRYPTINLCSKSYWDRTGHLARQYLVVSQVTGRIIWVPSWVKPHQAVALDTTRGQQFDCMAVDTMDARDWHDFVRFCNGEKVTEQ